MSSIWVESEGRWRLLAPIGYPDEATLHTQVEEAPDLLPLSGSPRIAILGREVQLGTGYADLIGVEASGRVVVIEVKLAKNPEARRAVVAQILAYAAYLKGMSLEHLERQVLRSQLLERGLESVAEAMPGAEADTGAFADAVTASLEAGRFRLVLVLDSAPSELVRLVGYLESIAPELAIDLITVSAYEINGAMALVPQRVDPGKETAEARPAAPRAATGSKAPSAGGLISVDEFERSIDEAREAERPALRQALAWARGLEEKAIGRLIAYGIVTGGTTLLPYPVGHDGGFITVYNDSRGMTVSVYRSVFERFSPELIEQVEHLIAPVPLGRGNSVRHPSPELYDVLTEAYRLAATRGPIRRA